ncbi:DUF7691 family protein [Nocardia sp. NPDC004123]
MSRFINVFVVDVDRVLASLDSQDEELLAAIAEENRADYELEAEESEPGELTELDALRELIIGPQGEWCYTHCQALETLCGFLGGERVHCFSYGGDLPVQIDQALTRLGVDSVSVDGFQEFCQWTHEQCQRASDAWSASSPDHLASLHPRLLECVELCMGWAQQAAATPSAGIFGVYYWGG